MQSRSLVSALLLSSKARAAGGDVRSLSKSAATHQAGPTTPLEWQSMTKHKALTQRDPGYCWSPPS